MAEELTEKALKQPGLSESFELPAELGVQVFRYLGAYPVASPSRTTA